MSDHQSQSQSQPHSLQWRSLPWRITLAAGLLIALLAGLTAVSLLPGSSASFAQARTTGPVIARASFNQTMGNPVAGAVLYTQQICATCHAPEGQGITGLGLPLDATGQVPSRTNAELVGAIRNGRSTMPPYPTLTDAQIDDLIAFMRSLAGVTRYTEAGCVACHGDRGQGVTGLGLPLDASGRVRTLSDDAIRTVIRSGAGLMPPNPSLTDTQLDELLAFTRRLSAARVYLPLLLRAYTAN